MENEVTVHLKNPKLHTHRIFFVLDVEKSRLCFSYKFYITFIIADNKFVPGYKFFSTIGHFHGSLVTCITIHTCSMFPRFSLQTISNRYISTFTSVKRNGHDYYLFFIWKGGRGLEEEEVSRVVEFYTHSSQQSLTILHMDCCSCPHQTFYW